MADLMTRIGADDSQFQAGMNRMDRRVTSFAQNTQRSFATMNRLVGGFGAAQFARNAIDMADRILQIQREQTAEMMKQVDAYKARNAAHDDFRRSLQGGRTLTENVSRTLVQNLNDISKRKADSISGINNESISTGLYSASANLPWRRFVPSLSEVAMMPFAGFGLYRYGQRLMGEDKARRISDLQFTAGTDASIEMAQSAKNLRAAALKMITDDSKVSYAHVTSRMRQLMDQTAEAAVTAAETAAKLAGARSNLRERFEDERIGAMRDSGLGREADQEANSLRYRRMRDEIWMSDALSEIEQRDAVYALMDREDIAAAAINRRFQEGMASRARSIDGTVGGGATFQQQMTLLNAPIEKHTKDIAANTKATSEKLDRVIDKLGSSGVYR